MHLFVIHDNVTAIVSVIKQSDKAHEPLVYIFYLFSLVPHVPGVDWFDGYSYSLQEIWKGVSFGVDYDSNVLEAHFQMTGQGDFIQPGNYSRMLTFNP